MAVLIGVLARKFLIIKIIINFIKMIVREEICIGNGKVLTFNGTEEPITENQKMMLKNIETDSNIVFDCYRQCGFTTLMLNLLVYYFKYKIGNFCFVVSGDNAFKETMSFIRKIFDFYGFEFNDEPEDYSFFKNQNGVYKVSSLNRSSSITLTTELKFNYGIKYEKIIIDNAAFMESDIMMKLYNINSDDCQIIAGSCHCPNDFARYKKSEETFSEIIKDIEEKKEPPYNWFHIYVRWWKDVKYKDAIKGQTNAKFLTPEMEGYLFNNGKRKFTVKSIEEIKKLLGINVFKAEINCNQECHE